MLEQETAPAVQADWYRDAIIYEMHVRTFYDSDGDGMGDFRGLTERLPYLRDLGVTAIWLLPFYPSPLKDDGYDIANYMDVHPQYGTLKDFRTFLREAHRLGLKVIGELVINHTSDQHPWFERARQAKPGSAARNFYVWSDTPDRYRDARVIFKDFERSNWTWDPVAKAYYWHRFYSHQPDLNFDSPLVRRAIFKVVDFWLGMGVDGLRLDAVPYLYEREGTTCENLPETHAFLRDLRRHVDQRFPGRMLLAEANQWPEDAVAYFGQADECHMAFHFPLMPRLFMAVYMEDRFPIVDILQQTPPIPETCQWALFLRNHDELTLEMVTDEERDYMYHVYATDPQARINLGIRRRLAPLLGNNRRRIELMNALLFALPGTPVLYYGNEIGMGDNIYLGDRDGVRTPMQWSADRNAGFSAANPQKLCLPVVVDPEYHYEAVNVEAQRNNPHSLLWWMKRLINLRKRYRAFGRGSMTLLTPDNPKILAFVRQLDDELLLVVANLSRFAQATALDLSAYRGRVPRELFGQTAFPAITQAPYPLTLGPHGFFYFVLAPSGVREPWAPTSPVTLAGTWPGLLTGPGRAGLEAALFPYLTTRRWFSARTRRPKSADVRAVLPVPVNGDAVHLAVVDVPCGEGETPTYWMALSAGPESDAPVIARVGGDPSRVVSDASEDPRFLAALLDVMARRRRLAADGVAVTGQLRPPYRRRLAHVSGVQAMPGDHTNTNAVVDQQVVLKLFRQIHPGMQPDWEMGLHLTRLGFPHVAPVAGRLEWDLGGQTATLGVLTAYVAHESDGWAHTRDALGRYQELVLARGSGSASESPSDAAVQELLGPYRAWTALLAQRTAELHQALATARGDPAFEPEPFTPYYLRSLYQTLRTAVRQTLSALARHVPALDAEWQQAAEEVLAQEERMLEMAKGLLEAPARALRIRCHGDLHLGQVLDTGSDFVFIDFEGEPNRPLSERRIKRSPLRDVAGMLRSFHYAAAAAWLGARPETADAGEAERLRRWCELWYRAVAGIFLASYRATLGDTDLVPAGDQFDAFLRLYVLEKALYELRYELDHRPDWVPIPLAGIRQLLAEVRP
jgi:maltose alpha-D-glucosyltransferase/alpha-amylase